ncbi:disintegrin and metalloproteinase domain-containing protein 10 [Lepeophtheirus salmonis]|uniref:disintegrin and metalloproteinase domain-containing protein 10 n=1 Tax=Lepeophtheirus salmonis TaxID=72036 RepID=UPI001AE28185|nr:disintegrin and metalloproteinase domain-containing protein 10-like [Lepeophtheirus salmonis]
MFGQILIYLTFLGQLTFGYRTRICNLMIGVDEPFWARHGKNMSQIEELAQEHVKVLNEIFTKQVLNESPYDDIEFRLQRLQVMFGSCDSFENTVTNCTAQRDNFLKAFDRHDFKEFCLAYMFSHRDFSGGTAGYASVGTVCAHNSNSGFITSLNYGVDRSLEDSTITFAHEVGHNFGAKHDSDYDDSECIKRDYIMNEVYDATLHPEGEKVDYKTQFSDCSITSMKKKLNELSTRDNLCFKPESEVSEVVETAICGNYIVEPGEECDCGLEDHDCADFCCYPAHISVYDRYQNMKAVPCTRNFDRYHCKYPPLLVYGIYFPFGFIIACTFIIFFTLRWDWRGQKMFFQHIRENQIHIIKNSS